MIITNIKSQNMKNFSKIAGIGLILGAVLQITRMIPIALSDGIIMLDNFPPHSLKNTLLAAQASGWHFSHILIFLATPLLFTGFYSLYQLATKTEKSPIAIYALIGLAMGLILYSMGAVIDGFVLPEVSKQYTAAVGKTKEYLGEIVFFTHHLAIGFGGFAFCHLLLSTGLLGWSLQKVAGFKILSICGTAIGGVALLGYLMGILDLLVSGSFLLTGGLTMLMFVYYLLLGVKLVKIKEEG